MQRPEGCREPSRWKTWNFLLKSSAHFARLKNLVTKGVWSSLVVEDATVASDKDRYVFLMQQK
jgi:hypothetical protein